MNWFLCAFLIIACVYLTGAVGFGLYYRKWEIGFAWPLWVIFSWVGNIQ